MSLYDQFATNQEKENEGVWVEFGAEESGKIPAFKISRMGKSNKRYVKLFERKIKPYRRQIQLETMKDSLADQIAIEVFVEGILLDWRNIENQNGEEMAFTKENAIQLLKDLPELYDDLQDKAQTASLFREESLEADAGN